MVAMEREASAVATAQVERGAAAEAAAVARDWEGWVAAAAAAVARDWEGLAVSAVQVGRVAAVAVQAVARDWEGWAAAMVLGSKGEAVGGNPPQVAEGRGRAVMSWAQVATAWGAGGGGSEPPGWMAAAVQKLVLLGEVAAGAVEPGREGRAAGARV